MDKKQYQKEWMQKRRHRFLQELGGKCVRCSSVEALEFDHIDPLQKTCNISALMSRKLDLILVELAKCQILCADCHLKKTKEDMKPKVHGITMYENHKCRCGTCKAAKSAKNKKRIR